jgi:hypothetical protein
MTNEAQSNRRRFLVDCEVQTAILLRIFIFGSAATLYFAITLVCTQWMNEPERTFLETLMKCLEDIAYWLPGFFLLGPIVAHDILKVTNQFSGPIHRLQEEMQLLANGESERPLSFREDDYWKDLTGAYNRLRGELLQLRKMVEEQNLIAAELPPTLIDQDDDLDDDLEDTVRLSLPPDLSFALPEPGEIASA